MFELALVVLLVMSGAASRAVGGSRRAGWALMAASLAWPLVNRPIEGPVLGVVAGTHGIALTDLLAVVGVVAATWVLSGRPGVLGDRATVGNSRCSKCGGSGRIGRDRSVATSDDSPRDLAVHRAGATDATVPDQ